MPRPSPDLPARARGALLGALAGGGPSPLLEILAEELAEGRSDLRNLAERWAAHAGRDPGGLDRETAAALEFLAAHHAPPPVGGRGSGMLGRLVPVALLAFRSPHTLVSATYHIAALTHGAPEAAWGAVAVNVALGRLLAGRRDVVPDVLEVLVANQAPERLLAAVRRVPLLRRETLPPPAAGAEDAVAGVELALGLARHEPLAERGFALLDQAGPTAAGAAAGALLGARDGEGAVPRELRPGPSARSLLALADRLVQPHLASA